MKLNIQDTFNKELPADKDQSNSRRQVKEACFSYVTPKVPSEPKLLHVSEEMAAEIGIPIAYLDSEEFLKLVTGAKVLEGTNPFAMCYGGHQFGNWAGQLGDGRAINLFEVLNNNKRWALQLKGAGETPYSRNADGLAVLRSSIREHLCSEAMYHLGVPTTRSLSLSLSGDQVLRDVMYDGNQAYEKGAIVCRVAPSFVRFGNFQIFASRNDVVNLRKLSDYTIKHFFTSIKGDSKDSYIAFFNDVVDRTLKMIVEWQRVGFVHGVMNTDNLSILGLTIDYGPYGWLEGYDPNWTPNTTDRAQRRYRYGNQPQVALWNLYQLANALYLLEEEEKPFQDALERFKVEYAQAELKMMRCKLGLIVEDDGDYQLVQELEKTLVLTETDMTIFYRMLATVFIDDNVSETMNKINEAFYLPEELTGEILDRWMAWMSTYLERIKLENIDPKHRKKLMDQNNPKYVLRNYMAQLAIDAADQGDYNLIDELYLMLRAPYDEQPEMEKWFVKRPDWARHKVGCSMLSCSS